MRLGKERSQLKPPKSQLKPELRYQIITVFWNREDEAKEVVCDSFPAFAESKGNRFFGGRCKKECFRILLR